jgi:hypothetical protein
MADGFCSLAAWRFEIEHSRPRPTVHTIRPIWTRIAQHAQHARLWSPVLKTLRDERRHSRPPPISIIESALRACSGRMFRLPRF